jgi:hypothetical protein
MDMDAPPEISHRTSLDQIAWEAYYKVARDLSFTLPKVGEPRDAATMERDRAAIAMVASLVPAGSAEANAAAHHVILSDIAMGCLRDFQDPSLNDDDRHQAFKWADSLLRQSNAKLALLLRMQAERRKREATPKGAMQSDYVEGNVTHLMAAAIGCATPEPTPPPEYEPEPERSTPPPDPILTDGERYAANYPKRAKAIREYGGMPAHETFGPPTRAVIKELLTSTSPRILAVDEA